MIFKNRQNEKIVSTDGRDFWISRSVAVCVCILRAKPENESILQVLAVKRGSAVSNTGKWCFPCGYLDWDETVDEAAIRECYEEANVVLEPADLSLYQVDSNPTKALQNVTVHYSAYLVNSSPESYEPKDKGEVEEIKWFDFEDAKNIEWAFDHGERVNNLIANG